MATSMQIIPQAPVTYTHVAYTVTTVKASPIPTLAATLTVGISGQHNGSKTTTSEVLTCTPTCVMKDSQDTCMQTVGCELKDFKPAGFQKQGEKISGAMNLWRDPGARLAFAVLGVSWVLGVAMLKAF